MYDTNNLINHLQKLKSDKYDVILENESFTSHRTDKIINIPIVTLVLKSTYEKQHKSTTDDLELKGVLAKLYPDNSIWIRPNLFPEYNEIVAQFIHESNRVLN